MEDYETIPNIEWGEDCSYDTLHSIITGWCARIWVASDFGTSRTILIARWDGAGSGSDVTNLMVWSEKDQDYCVPMVVKTGNIKRISIL
jgi:hypothetical protein